MSCQNWSFSWSHAIGGNYDSAFDCAIVKKKSSWIMLLFRTLIPLMSMLVSSSIWKCSSCNLQTYSSRTQAWTNDLMNFIPSGCEKCIGQVPFMRDFLGLRFPCTRMKPECKESKNQGNPNGKWFILCKHIRDYLNLDYHSGSRVTNWGESSDYGGDPYEHPVSGGTPQTPKLCFIVSFK